MSRVAIAGAVISALGLSIAVLWPSGPSALPPAVELASIDAELFYLDASDIARRGSGRVAVLRFNRAMDFAPQHFNAAGLDKPQTSERWAEHLDAPVVINAGQFDENLDHLGWLKRDGTWLVSHLKSAWKGLLVSTPTKGPPWSGVIDLERSSIAIAEVYDNVTQSMMLVDDQQKVRVRDSELTACRTVVAQDQEGRVLFIVTEGATTLADLARWLPKTNLRIVRAMNMDGGIESQMSIRTPELEMTFYGQLGTGTTVFDAGPGKIRYPLPAVISARPTRSTDSAAQPQHLSD